MSFSPTSGSWTHLGKDTLRVKKPNATMNLGWIRPEDTLSDDERGAILHQFGHVIGSAEDHKNPRRGKKLTLNEKGELC